MRIILIALLNLCCLITNAQTLPKPFVGEHSVALPDPNLDFDELESAWLPDPLPSKKVQVNLHKRWEYATHLQFEDSHLRPFVSQHSIYLAGKGGQVMAMNRHNGVLQWHTNTDLPLSSGPHVAYGLMALGCADGSLVVLDSKTGKKLWQKHLSNEILATPIINADRIFVKTSDNTLWAIDKKTGHTLWRRVNESNRLRLRGDSAPLVSSKVVFAGFSNGRLVAFDSATGQVLWQRSIGRARGFSDVEQLVDINADLKRAQHTLYAVSYKGFLSAVNDKNGDIVWQSPLSSYSNIALTEDYLLITDDKHELWAFDRSSGRVVWHEDHLAKSKIGPPTVLDTVVWMGDSDGTLHARALGNGHPLGHLRVAHSAIVGAPLAFGKELYTLSARGNLTAFRQL